MPMTDKKAREAAVMIERMRYEDLVAWLKTLSREKVDEICRKAA